MPQNKTTPLHAAAKAGHTESVQLLLAANGNPNAENRVSSLPIHMIEVRGAEMCGAAVQDHSVPAAYCCCV